MALRKFATGLALLTVLLGAAKAVATETEEGRFSGALSLSSDYVFRGVSQTMGGLALQGYINAELGHGFYTYVWGSNIDFHPDTEPDDHVRMEIDLGVGYFAEFADHWSIDVSYVRYAFPSLLDGIDYDYNDLIATLGFDDSLEATVAYAENVDGTDASARFYALASSFELPFELGLNLKYGYYDIEDAHGDAYSYASATLTRYFEESSIALSFNDTFSTSDDVFYRESIGSRVMLSVEFGF